MLFRVAETEYYLTLQHNKNLLTIPAVDKDLSVSVSFEEQTFVRESTFL